MIVTFHSRPASVTYLACSKSDTHHDSGSGAVRYLYPLYRTIAHTEFFIAALLAFSWPSRRFQRRDESIEQNSVQEGKR